MNPLLVALAVSAAANLWLATTRYAARQAARSEDERCYLTSRAAVHLVNDTTSGDPDVAEEQVWIRFQARVEQLAAGQELSPFERVTAHTFARRQLVLEGHMTLDYAEQHDRWDLEGIGEDPVAGAATERAVTEDLLATRVAS